MKKLFCICDYIKVSSGEFAKEVEEKFIHFEMPSKDVRFWTKECKSSSGDDFAALLSGKVLHIKDNCLTIELPKDLSKDYREKNRLVETIFGNGGPLHEQFEIPQKYFDGTLDTSVKVVAGDYLWTTSGRTISVTFSTEVRLKKRIPRLSRALLRKGVPCKETDSKKIFQIIQELLLNPDGVEYFGAGADAYVIKKSNDEDVLQCKFRLQYAERFHLDQDNILDFIKIFYPDKFSEEMKMAVTQGYDRYQHKFYSHRLTNCSSCYKIDFYQRKDGRYLAYVESLIDAFKKCIEKIEQANRLSLRQSFPFKKLEEREYRFRTTMGEVSLTISDFDVVHVNALQGIEKELKSRVCVLQFCSDFLRQNLQAADSSDQSIEDEMVEIAFRKIWLDPISYTDESAGKFRNFAMSLI